MALSLRYMHSGVLCSLLDVMPTKAPVPYSQEVESLSLPTLGLLLHFSFPLGQDSTDSLIGKIYTKVIMPCKGHHSIQDHRTLTTTSLKGPTSWLERAENVLKAVPREESTDSVVRLNRSRHG